MNLVVQSDRRRSGEDLESRRMVAGQQHSFKMTQDVVGGDGTMSHSGCQERQMKRNWAV